MASIPHHHPALAASYRGILWMLMAGFLFATQDVIAKHLSVSYPTTQILWGRFIVPVVVLAIYFNRRLPGIMATRRPGLQLVRSGLLCVMLGLLFSAYRSMPLADATAIMFIGPILVTALSLPVLGEHVGPRRWAAVALGFAGALVIVRPGVGVLQGAAFLALGAAVVSSTQLIMIRVLSRDDSAMTTLVYSPLVGALATSGAMAFLWVAPDLEGWLLMALLGILGVGSQFGTIKAFETAPAATVSPFLYVVLIWAGVYGFAVFGDIPDAWTLLGAAVIVASGLYIFHRERIRDRAAAATATATATAESR
ncbi:MAG: DMT family transporter [Rhodospirillales bacterium]|jgi:drug/metabolite transporter (DMT)-like permease|nr:DMT family transporter [Rhodospirillales bacterium]MDP6773052.1 DMT family transporter [Rhodospirillales bacterium]